MDGFLADISSGKLETFASVYGLVRTDMAAILRFSTRTHTHIHTYIHIHTVMEGVRQELFLHKNEKQVTVFTIPFQSEALG